MYLSTWHVTSTQEILSLLNGMDRRFCHKGFDKGQRDIDIRLNYSCHDTYTNKILILHHTSERICPCITENTYLPDKSFLGNFYSILEVSNKFLSLVTKDSCLSYCSVQILKKQF